MRVSTAGAVAIAPNLQLKVFNFAAPIGRRETTSMAVTTHRISAFESNVAEKKESKDAPKIWENLLKSVSSGRRLAEKQLLLFGGSPDYQREFLESLSSESQTTRRQDRQRKPPIANQFALGYTYQDVLDADQEDILARVSVYTLSDPLLSYASLLEPLFTTKTIPHTLAVILLDWSQPWNWIRQLLDWIRLLRAVVQSLPNESKVALEKNVEQWRDVKRSVVYTEGTTQATEESVVLPPGPGEWDEPLGVPLCVVAHNADKIEQLEKERGWKDDKFDFIMQYLRTILLKHGGSLIYTMPAAQGSLQSLIHSSLDIHSTLQKRQLKHNITDRDNILVPCNWDSWSRIRIMTDNFDVEAVSKAWSHDIATAISRPAAVEADGSDTARSNGSSTPVPQNEFDSASVSMYSDVIKDPKITPTTILDVAKPTNGIEITTRDTQAFLAEQADILKSYGAEDEKDKLVRDAKKPAVTYIPSTTPADERKDIEEHIGPVQFNMGGIQVDADEVVKRLKDREANREANRLTLETPSKTLSTERPTNDIEENERLSNFFASLIKKPGGSATNSPRRSADRE